MKQPFDCGWSLHNRNDSYDQPSCNCGQTKHIYTMYGTLHTDRIVLGFISLAELSVSLSCICRAVHFSLNHIWKRPLKLNQGKWTWSTVTSHPFGIVNVRKSVETTDWIVPIPAVQETGWYLTGSRHKLPRPFITTYSSRKAAYL